MTHQPQDPLLGQVLDGRYAITRRLGTGGMGAVYEAHQQRLDRKVAIKTIHAHLATKAVVIERFRREAMAAASAGSPHIVDVYDLGVMPSGAPYMVMELIEGTDLRTLVETRGRLAASVAAHVIRQACDALDAAHEVGIIHRDMKPENIMITQRRNDPHYVKVVDFGISKLRDSSLTGSHELLGTPYAMAPEQLRGAGHVDARCDVYGLGVCLYWALSAQVPYEAESLPLLISQISTGRGIPLRSRIAELPPVAYDLVDTAMAREPDARFRTMSAFAAALRTLENPSPAAALAPTAPTPTREPPRAPRPAPPLVESKRVAASEPVAEPKTHATMLDHGGHARDTTRGGDRLPTTFGSKLFRAVITLGALGIVGAGGLFGYRAYDAWRGEQSPVIIADAGSALLASPDAGASGDPGPDFVPPQPPVAPTTVDVRGLPGARVESGERSCVSPCSLTLAVDATRVRVRYAEHEITHTVPAGRTTVVRLGAARVELADRSHVTLGPHECQGSCTVPLTVGSYTADARFPTGAASSQFRVREGEITDVHLLRLSPPTLDMAGTTGTLLTSGRAVRIQVSGSRCTAPCELELPPGTHRALLSFANGAITYRQVRIVAGQVTRLAAGRAPTHMDEAQFVDAVDMFFGGGAH